MQQEIGAANCLTIFMYRDYRKWWDGLLTKPEKLTYTKSVVDNAGQILMKFNPDVIIFDMSGEGEYADACKKANWTVIGGSEFCDFLEFNRWYGMSTMKAVGLPMPAAFEVKDYNAAVEFLQKRNREERWVIKFNDNQGNFSSYCSEDVVDMLEELEHFMDSSRVNFKSGAVLQEYVKGIELSCEGWFDGETFIESSFNYTMEEKKFLTGSLGPSTGCEGNLVWKADPRDTIPVQMYRMVPLLRQYRYVGPFDLNNMIATESHVYDGFAPILTGRNYVLEPTPRFGYDAIYTLLEGYKGKLSDLFGGLAYKEVKNFDLVDEPLVGIRVSIPPYPYNDISQTEDKMTEGLAKSAMKFMEHSVAGTITRLKEPRYLEKVWFQDIRWDERHTRLVVNGTDSVIAVCTAHKPNLEAAIEEAYKIVKTVDVPNAQYRLDIGKRAFDEIPKLVELGVLRRPSWLKEEQKHPVVPLLGENGPNGSAASERKESGADSEQPEKISYRTLTLPESLR